MEQPLVSVPVITYNSSKYVHETLESIKAQTYQNIELIISDDCSTDNTVELCRKWVEENKERFVRTQIITSELNTGVSANLNRAEAVCQGEWVKSIAGDDLLLPNCVETFVSYVTSHLEEKFIFSMVDIFTEGEDVEHEELFDYSFFSLSADEQYKRLVTVGNCLPAPTFFYNRVAANRVGLHNDERIRSFEDWPKWVYLTKKHIKLGVIAQPLVRYRLRSTSITHSPCKSYDESYERFFYYYLYEPMCKFNFNERKKLRGMYYSIIKKYRFSVWAMVKYQVYKLLHRLSII